MAAGEYVSVSSQEDTEQADLARERKELESEPEAEERELAGIYVHRGIEPALAPILAVPLVSGTRDWVPFVAAGLLKVVYDLLLLRYARAEKLSDTGR